ncbi:hypothetical protein ACFXTI_006427 [Malus domestica]
MNMVRNMLSEKKIPKTFWPEATNWTIHILNRSPTLAVKNKTPKEAWNERKPFVEHFRVFGCISYVHILDSKRIKIDDKSLKCIFLGVSEESKAYRLFDPISHKIIMSRDVVFDENQSWNWNDSHEEVILVDLEWETEEENSIETGDNEEEHAVDILREAVENEDSVQETGESSSRAGRTRRPPIWMRDFVSGEVFSEEDDVNENLAHLALFSDVDPISYEDAVRSETWRQAMDAEIEAIERNDTWELTELPFGG